MLNRALPTLSANAPLGVDPALPTLGDMAPAVNLVIDIALVAFLLYILLAARKGR